MENNNNMVTCECGREYVGRGMQGLNKCPGCFRPNTDPEYKKKFKKTLIIALSITIPIAIGLLIFALVAISNIF